MEREPDHVNECMEKLLDAIRTGNTFRRFEEISRRLEGQVDLKERIDSFREKAYQVSNKVDTDDMLDEMRVLFEERRKIRENSLAAEYLSAELELCRMLQHICLEVMSIIDLQIDSFIDRIDI